LSQKTITEVKTELEDLLNESEKIKKEFKKELEDLESKYECSWCRKAKINYFFIEYKGSEYSGSLNEGDFKPSHDYMDLPEDVRNFGRKLVLLYEERNSKFRQYVNENSFFVIGEIMRGVVETLYLETDNLRVRCDSLPSKMNSFEIRFKD